MKVTEMNNLFVARFPEENFTILIHAFDQEEAMDTALSYASDAGFEMDYECLPNTVVVEEFTDPNTQFDCDYVVSSCDGE